MPVRAGRETAPPLLLPDELDEELLDEDEAGGLYVLSGALYVLLLPELLLVLSYVLLELLAGVKAFNIVVPRLLLL